MIGFAVVKFIHLLLISIWVGGQFFLPLVVLPALKNSPNREHIIIQAGIQFRKVGFFVLTLILLTGLAMFYLRTGSFSALTQTGYGHLFLSKLVLFLVMWLANYYHEKYMLNEIGKPGFSYKNIRLTAKISGYLTFLLSLFLVFIGIMLSAGIIF